MLLLYRKSACLTPPSHPRTAPQARQQGSAPPWSLSFSFGRALQHSVLKLWASDHARCEGGGAKQKTRQRDTVPSTRSTPTKQRFEVPPGGFSTTKSWVRGLSVHGTIRASPPPTHSPPLSPSLPPTPQPSSPPPTNTHPRHRRCLTTGCSCPTSGAAAAKVGRAGREVGALRCRLAAAAAAAEGAAWAAGAHAGTAASAAMTVAGEQRVNEAPGERENDAIRRKQQRWPPAGLSGGRSCCHHGMALVARRL